MQMKKLIHSVYAMAMVALALTSCEDVPAPFDNGSSTNPSGAYIAPAGDGTAASPYNVTKALKLITDGTYTSSRVYVKGIVTGISDIDPTYGNATYELGAISDADTTLTVYRGYYFNGSKFTSTDDIAMGDTILLRGVLTIYNGTKEVTQGSSIITINGKDAYGNTVHIDSNSMTPKGEGTAESPYNVAKADSISSSLAADVPTGNVYVEGIIVGTPNIDTNYGNATFTISDDGSGVGEYTIYRSYYYGGAKYTSTDQLKTGDKVVLLGKLINFRGTTPEMNTGGRLISLNGVTVSDNTGGETGGETGGTSAGVTIEGTTVTAANPDLTAGTVTATLDLNTLGLANATDATTYTLSDGSTITFGAGTNPTNGPKYYTATKGVRLYANNTISFAGKAKIAKIIFTCDSYNGTDYVGNSTATVTFDGNNATYTNTFAENKGGVQLRVKTVTVVYAQ
jgi:hypothetical protein